MRFISRVLLVLVLALQLTVPALAQNGGNGNGNQGRPENPGNGNGGNSGNNGNGGGGKAEGAPDGIIAIPDDQQVVRDAVRARSALSLEAITAVVAEDTDGRILDLQLVTYKGTYLYDVTVLEPDGVLHKLYYNARSGARVRTD
jgi:hypothetical protein